MKMITELTDDEVFDLTSEQVQEYIEKTLVLNNIPLTPSEEPTPPAPLRITPDVPVYRVMGVCFTDKEEAEHIAQLLNECKSLVSVEYTRVGSTYEYIVKAGRTASVDMQMHYSASLIANRSTELGRLERAQNQYEKLLLEWQDAEKKREPFRQRVWDFVHAANERVSFSRSFQSVLDKYMAITSDRVQALKLIKAAYPDVRYQRHADTLLERIEDAVAEATQSEESNLPY